MKQSEGFTLIELMIVVVIIGILASIAYPSYTAYLAKGARGDGIAAVMRIVNLQEQFYLDNREYTADMVKLGLKVDPFVVENQLYKVDSSVNSGAFTVTATAQGIQASRDAPCVTISMNSIGEKTPKECWK
ncbi:type IV pilin protein [Shewanella sp. SP1S2-4]|uniref:type IV pilin protein n=1 Tax=Shewanella sp. SP1S2-4 TaxID=3063537 RepID=UPI00288E9C06|nr:type IV pilin protein [Shewanella sp. SP1S2-4]MDT3318550.1 type IV pilin protein [Shewanella sp. SP1S2-4]